MNFCFGKMIGVGNSKRLLAPVNKYLDISSKYKQPTLWIHDSRAGCLFPLIRSGVEITSLAVKQAYRPIFFFTNGVISSDSNAYNAAPVLVSKIMR